MADYEIVIRGGLVADGSGGEPFVADVAIADGRIAAVGTVSGRGREEIAAGGCLVTPGFVDIHTHYDAQATWDHSFAPSTDHGVTTVVIGNCSVGVAPCRPAQRPALLGVMAGVEDVPEAVLEAGLPWTWETFPEFLSMLEVRAFDADVAALLPHAPLRVYVMGQRGIDREMATVADLAEMGRLAGEALATGAIGISTSRTLSHRDASGRLAPGETAGEEELMTLARALRRAGAGILQYISDFPGLPDHTADFDLMRRLAETARAPLTFLLTEKPPFGGDWTSLLALTEQAVADGLDITAQVAPRSIGISFGLDLTYNPFSYRPSYTAIADLPLAERVRRLRQPDLRAAILAERNVLGPRSMGWYAELMGEMVTLTDPPNYEPAEADRIRARAAAAGRSVEEQAYDDMLDRDGKAILYLPRGNYQQGNLDVCLTMMRHPDAVVGLGDGGAHYGMICDASYPTFLLTHWARDRAGAKLTVAEAVRALTRRPAEVIGLTDRGLVAPGLKADLNVIDMARLSLAHPDVRHDLPGGGRRMMQAARGYVATVLSGTITRRDDQPTGVLPGRLVRGAAAARAGEPGA